MSRETMSWFVKRLAVIGRTILAAAAALGPLATTSPALGSAFSSEPLPVPVSIDGERIQSSMFLQVELERYGIPFDAFSNGISRLCSRAARGRSRETRSAQARG